MRQILGSILLSALVSTAVESQTVRRVPGGFPTIQSAITAAQSGDTVRVAPGVYVENINFLGKAITVVSEAGADVTTIDGGGAGTVVQISNGEGPNSMLDGFTIRNGKGSSFVAGGIQIAGSPTIRRNRIINNVGCAVGVGISISSGSPIIQGNFISNNVTQGCSGGDGGAGILVNTSGSTQILDNAILNNLNNASTAGGGISVRTSGPTLIRGNIITGNKGTYGGGIGLTWGSTVTIIQNVIAGNTASQGGGVYWQINPSGGLITVTNNTIVDNSVSQSGSAIFADGFDGSNPVTNNIIIGKTGQAAIYCGNSGDTIPPIFAFNDAFVDQASAYSGFCTDATGTNGNISAAPLFVDRVTQNLRLLPGSPGIDGGTNTAVGFPVDLDSFPRIVPFGGTVDMGAYEFATATTSTTFPTSLTFADQDAGTVSAPSDVTLTNTGSAVLLVSTVVVTGEFSQTNTCQTLTGIPAGQSCVISVRFAPTVGGPRSGQLKITSNSVSSVVSLSGNGVGELSLSTDALTFIDQRIGTTSPATTLSISNTGSAELNIASISAAGDYTSSSDCPATVNAGSSCTISVRFAPTARGIRLGAITISAQGNVYIVPLSGHGVTPLIIFSPSSVGFAAQINGTVSSPQTLTVSNPGDVALEINSISITGDFTGTNNCGVSLEVNATCTINVTFSPTGLGLRVGSITISDGAIGSPHTVSIFGMSISPLSTPTSLVFASQAINTTSVGKLLTLRNTSSVQMTVTNVVASSEFSVISNSCSFLSPNGTCFLSVTFTPASIGPRTGTLTITNSVTASPYIVPLSGTGTDIVFSPNPISFGDFPIGAVSPHTTILTNNSPNPVNITSISTTSRYSQQNNCGASLAPGANCAIDVTFAPVTAGLFVSGTLAVTDDAIGSPHTVSLSGRGIAPFVTLLPTTLVFGSDLVGTTSLPQSATLSNFGTSVLAISSIATSGDFAQTNNCGTALSITATCSLTVTFSPTGAGTRTGSLIIASDGLGSSNTVSLSGTGLASLPIPVITTISPDNASSGSSGITLTVSGSGFSSLSKVRWDGADRQTTFVNNTTLTASIPASDLAFVGTFPVSIFNPAPGGGSSNTAGFVVYRATALMTKDLIYDRVGARIFASVPAAAPTMANTLTVIDPATGSFGTSAAIGSDPGKLAISDDSHLIYVALDGTGQVRPFDTTSQTAGVAFALGNVPGSGTDYAEDISVVPGSPGVIAVSRKNLGVIPRHAGVAIYDNGIQRPVVTPGHTGSNVIEFSASPSILYGYNNETSEWGFRTMSVDGSGVVINHVQPNLISGNTIDIQFEGGRIYTTSGLVVDPISNSLLGTFPLREGGLVAGDNPRGIVADAGLQRAFILFATSTDVQILAFDLNTFLLTGRITLPAQGASSNLGGLIRWGDNGLAFRSGTQVFTFQIPRNWLPAIPVALTVSKSGSGSGAVSTVPAGIDCGATCSATFTSGQVVALTATPSPGSIFAGWSGDGDCIDGNVTMAGALNCTARFTVPPVAAGDSFRVDKGGTLNVSAPGVLVNDVDADGNPISAVQMTSTVHGTVILNPDGSFSYVHNGSDGISDSFTYKANDGFADSSPATVTLDIDGLFVNQFQPTFSGFVAQFSQPIDATALNLFNTEAGGFGPSDVTLAGNSVGPVSGSVVVSGNGGTVTFIRTGGVLPPDTYTATLRSAANGFMSSSVGMLDGNHDGTAGDSFSTTFTVPNSPAVVVSIPDFLRGPGQDVSLSGTGIPVMLSDGSGVSQVDLVMKYDPSLLVISQVTAGAGLPAGSQVQADFSLPDRVHVIGTLSAPLAAGSMELFRIAAQVRAAAPYGAGQILAITSLRLNGGAIPAMGDDGLHIAAYFGDTTGNGNYSSLDAQRILRVVAGLDSGFAAFARIDPVVVADITGNGVLSSLDATRLLQEIVGIDRPEIPPLP